MILTRLAQSCLALFAFALSGCLSSSEPNVSLPVSAPEDSSSRVLAWGLTECRFLNWYVPVEPGRLASRLPEGFAPVERTDPVSLALGRAYLGFEAFQCREGVGLNGTLRDVAYGSLFTSVVPPEERREEDIDGFYVKWDVLIPDADRRAFLGAEGLPARNGATNVEDGALPNRAAATVRLEGVGTFSFDGTVAESATSRDPAHWLEFQQASGGLALWRTKAVDRVIASGRGTWTAEEGSWPAEVLGATSGVTNFITGTWTFANATLELPP